MPKPTSKMHDGKARYHYQRRHYGNSYAYVRSARRHIDRITLSISEDLESRRASSQPQERHP